MEKGERESLIAGKVLVTVGTWGLLQHRVVSNYIASTIVHVGQLEDLPRNWPEHEKQLIQILFPGPHRRLPAEIAKEMHHWGMPKDSWTWALKYLQPNCGYPPGRTERVADYKSEPTS